MKKSLIAFTLISIFFIINSCRTVPITGREQLNIIPALQMMSMSYQQYSQFLSENKLSKNKKQTAMIKRVGAKIQKAVEQYFKQNKIENHLKGY